MNKEITIYVSGRTGIGKSRLSYALKEFLKENGFEVEVNDYDYQDEKTFNSRMRPYLQEVIEKIKKLVKIKLIFSKEAKKFTRGDIELKVSDKALQRQKRINEILQ